MTGPYIQKPVQPGSDPDEATLLERVLAAAPFRVEVSSEAGATLFDSGAGSRSLTGEHVLTRRFVVSEGGATYTLALSLDETEQQEREQDLIRRAYFDELTGLPNRTVIERSANALIASRAPQFAMAFIDLDGFKHVNDYYGHDAGDQLLAKLAERLGAMLRKSDMLARLSGDEFALLLSPVESMEALAEDIRTISERIKEPFFIDGHEVFTSASIGISLYPAHGSSYEVLRANADQAMYRGKNNTKGAICFYEDSIERAVTARNKLEQRLRLAIRDRRVCCAYQPKVDLRTGAISGIEVLMRWIDEDGAIQPPGEFLSLATELGLMDDLTHFILNETVSSVDLINDAFGRDCSISINVAAKQAGDRRFMRSLVDAVDATGFAKRFMLELTEEAFIAKSEFQDTIVPMIREAGARVSIDDFGIGYSSLSALADITADEVKVDRAFITEVHRRPRSQSILKAIEALGFSLGMNIVVEGVETFEEVAYLQAATRIHYAQGHYFSRPMLLGDVEKRLAPETSLRPSSPARDAQSGRSLPRYARS
ncbi:MAG TPA: EAL domain-containing protein [Rhizobiaceae bacterium]|nr:EAL domain-containing protein [Rhizobiaceae bacterium]